MSKLLDVLKTMSPLLNLALPGSGLVLSGLLSLFGAKNSDELADKLLNDPEAMIKLKQFELEHELELQKIAQRDKSSAREREKEITKITGKQDWLMNSLALLITLGFYILCLIVAFTKMDTSDHDIFYMLLGVFGSGFACVLNYYFGSSIQTKMPDFPLKNSQ